MCRHAHFSILTQDTVVDNNWGMKLCCNRRVCVLMFKHEKKINENEVQADIGKNPRKYLGHNAMQRANVWLNRERQLDIPNISNPDIYWD